MAIVENIVDNFLQSCAENLFFPLVNPIRFLLKNATPYLSVEILETPYPSGGFTNELYKTLLMRGFHSSP
jgi:hypothetical protein